MESRRRKSMYKTYWSMTTDPFTKELPVRDSFRSCDYEEIMKRLEYLKKVRGIGIITGTPGGGKTRAVHSFTEGLNPNLHKVVYTAVTNVSEAELFRNIAIELGLQPEYKKGANMTKINERMRRLYKDQGILPVVVIDEAHCIRKPEVFLSLQSVMNFEMDSRDYGILILIGQPRLNDTLALGVNESFADRIRINYMTNGMNREEVKEYIISRMRIAEASPEIFDPAAIEAAFGCCQGSVRKLNSILQTALLEGCNRKTKTISSEIIMAASSELAVV